MVPQLADDEAEAEDPGPSQHAQGTDSEQPREPTRRWWVRHGRGRSGECRRHGCALGDKTEERTDGEWDGQQEDTSPYSRGRLAESWTAPVGGRPPL
jgi:hypothetical protein